MENTVLMAALAGLLHDVGKIAQRASNEHRVSVPGFEGDGQPAHSTFTAHFIQNHVPKSYRTALAGAYHHDPKLFPGDDKRLSKLIAIADKLSMGEKVDAGENKTQPQQIISVFDRVTLTGAHREKGWHYLPLRPLALDKSTLFPNPKTDRDGYKALLDHLIDVAEQDTGDLQSYGLAEK